MSSAQLAKFVDNLRSSYWFLPFLMVCAAGFLALACIYLDYERILASEFVPSWIRVREPEVARVILATIAGAMATIVSLSFSISIVTLTLAASHFGSRLLYNFMRDRRNQVTLGIFLGTFVYCLVALTAVRSGNVGVSLQFTVSLAILASLTSVLWLVFFIHHIAASIQATSVITQVGNELALIVERNTSEGVEQAENQRRQDSLSTSLPPIHVRSRRAGVVQAIDRKQLLRVATEKKVTITLVVCQGEFVIKGGIVAEVSDIRDADQELVEGIWGGVVLGDRRTLVEDIDFAFCQLVEIAVRALSPGINDPYTAMRCLDELGNGLGIMAQRGEVVAQLLDGDGTPRVFLKVTSFDQIAKTTISQIGHHSRNNPSVMLHILITLSRLASVLQTPRQRETILALTQTIRKWIGGSLTEDQESAMRRHIAVLEDTLKLTA